MHAIQLFWQRIKFETAVPTEAYTLIATVRKNCEVVWGFVILLMKTAAQQVPENHTK
jgi:hypothetical protein